MNFFPHPLQDLRQRRGLLQHASGIALGCLACALLGAWLCGWREWLGTVFAGAVFGAALGQFFQALSMRGRFDLFSSAVVLVHLPNALIVALVFRRGVSEEWWLQALLAVSLIGVCRAALFATLAQRRNALLARFDQAIALAEQNVIRG